MFVGVILIGGLSSAVIASTTFRSTLVKGTEQLIVNQYDDTKWKNTVDPLSTPSDWFEGDANITDAMSKVTVKGWNNNPWQTYDVLTTIFMSVYFDLEEIIILLGIMESQGYNETTINTNYTTTYSLWYGLSAVWNFTNNVYEEKPSYSAGLLILQDPSDFNTILDDYNNLAAELNGNMAIIMSGYTFPILNEDEFLWQLVFNGLTIAEPQTEYLEELISELGVVNASSSGSTLIIERYGVTNYTVEISYGSKGMISTFTVKDLNDDIIYQIIAINSDWIFYTILIIIVIVIVGLIGYIVYRRRKLRL